MQTLVAVPSRTIRRYTLNHLLKLVIVLDINSASCLIYRKKSVAMTRFMREVVATCVADSRNTTGSSTNAVDRTTDLDSRLLLSI